MLGWIGYLKVELDQATNDAVTAYLGRVRAWPGVAAAHDEMNAAAKKAFPQ